MFAWLKRYLKRRKKARAKHALDHAVYEYWRGEKYLMRRHRKTGVEEKLYYNDWVAADAVRVARSKPSPTP